MKHFANLYTFFFYCPSLRQRLHVTSVICQPNHNQTILTIFMYTEASVSLNNHIAACLASSRVRILVITLVIYYWVEVAQWVMYCTHEQKVISSTAKLTAESLSKTLNPQELKFTLRFVFCNMSKSCLIKLSDDQINVNNVLVIQEM